MSQLYNFTWSDKQRRLAVVLLLLLAVGFLVGIYFILLGQPENAVERKSQYDYKYLSTGRNFQLQQNYLVWNPKCHMLSTNPYDPSIMALVKKEEFEACSNKPKLSYVSREPNGSIYLLIDQKAAENYDKLTCCWAPVSRLENPIVPPENIDWTISKVKSSKVKSLDQLQYENVHAVIDPARARSRLTRSTPPTAATKAAARNKSLSVLLLGIDSVSRLNFHRTMPATRAYFDQRGWTELRGYNKMADNTFPNLMAVLTGHNESWACSKCKPQMLYGLDNCSMIWYNFRDAGYATAYAEDHAYISTFNYLKVGFVEPPTDYYLRPYVLATEKLLKSRQRFSSKYCTGSELSIDRIFDVAVDFSKAFLGAPSFGLFWTNTISHDSLNGPSMYDTRLLAKLQDMESHGVMNHSAIVMFSDHGMRYGGLRDTFVGWYEERLPFIYIWLPDWFRKQNPEAYAALRINQNRLTSPYDLYETLRDILQRAGGQVPPSSGCPKCSTLLKPVPHERGCREAGIAPHWCTCQSFQLASDKDAVVLEGANKFVEHMENIVKQYKNKTGERLCSKPKLKRIIRAKKMLDLDQDPKGKVLKLLYLLETSPGGGKFETTLSYNGPGNYTILEEEVSRTNYYGHSAKCLSEGFKKYCHCVSS